MVVVMPPSLPVLLYCFKRNDNIVEVLELERPLLPGCILLLLSYVIIYVGFTKYFHTQYLSYCLLHLCEIDRLIAVSQMRELRLRDEALQLQSQEAEGSLTSYTFQHSHQN